jgi:hypothetical protein
MTVAVFEGPQQKERAVDPRGSHHEEVQEKVPSSTPR